MNINDLRNGFQYGMHGCGYYKGVSHVNALESMKYWRTKGVNVMEIDICKTGDGKFVALAHLMNDYYLNRIEIAPSIDYKIDNQRYTEGWFLGKKICENTTGGLTTMNLNMIVDELSLNPEMIVMFDLWRMWDKDDTKLFSNQLVELDKGRGVLDRCVIEVYNKEMLNGIKEAKKRLNTMYCVHAPNDPKADENVTPYTLKEMGVNVISFPWESTFDHPMELETYHKEGFIIFSLYKDNRYYREMKKAGVNVNLVDVLYQPNSVLYVLFEKSKSIVLRGFRKLKRVIGLAR